MSNKARGISCGQSFSGRNGIDALLGHFLSGLLDDGNRFQPADLCRLGAVIVDLITALLAHELNDSGALEPSTHQRSLLMRIHAFIQQHLGDHALTPATVAAAHHISTRQLHRLFQGRPSVAAWIRQRRLEHCRHDLIDPTLAAKPIQAIAARWGLTNPAQFCRAFSAAYGMSPNDYRKQAQGRTTARTTRIVKYSSRTDKDIHASVRDGWEAAAGAHPPGSES